MKFRGNQATEKKQQQTNKHQNIAQTTQFQEKN